MQKLQQRLGHRKVQAPALREEWYARSSSPPHLRLVVAHLFSLHHSSTFLTVALKSFLFAPGPSRSAFALQEDEVEEASTPASGRSQRTADGVAHSDTSCKVLHLVARA